MIKKLFLWIVVLAIAAFALVYFFGAGWVTKAVETVGPKVTQTPVRLDDVDLSLLSSSGTLQGLYIGNPEGYKHEHIFTLGKIDVEVDAKSLLSDEIVIKKIHIRSPEMNYEKTLRGSNLKSLLANVESFGRTQGGEGRARETASAPGSSAEPSPDVAEEASSKRILIQDLLIEDLKVRVGLMGAGTSVTIPRIAMQDLDSASTTETVAKVLQSVLGEVTRQIGAGVSNMGGSTLSGLESVGKQALGQKKEEVLEQAEKELEKAEKEIEDAVGKDLLEGVKNLFGK
ncbi:MAG: hypothetical protein ACPGGJ_04225 [Coraliomargarita sp.]